MKDMKTAVAETVAELLQADILSRKEDVLEAFRLLNSEKFNPGALSLLCVMIQKGLVTSLDEALTVGEELTTGTAPQERAREGVVRAKAAAPRAVAPLIVPQGAQPEAVAKTMGRTPPVEVAQAAPQRGKRQVTQGRIRYDASGRVLTAQEMGQAPAVPIIESITADRNYLICLEDGVQKQMLKRYLNTVYGMTPEEYKAKWVLPNDYPMTAPNYSLLKSQSAANLGLGTHERRAAAAQKKEAQAKALEMAD
jgi:predicted transcriptional regulator